MLKTYNKQQREKLPVVLSSCNVKKHGVKTKGKKSQTR